MLLGAARAVRAWVFGFTARGFRDGPFLVSEVWGCKEKESRLGERVTVRTHGSIQVSGREAGSVPKHKTRQ